MLALAGVSFVLGGRLTGGEVHGLEAEQAEQLAEGVVGRSTANTFVLLFESSTASPGTRSFDSAVEQTLAIRNLLSTNPVFTMQGSTITGYGLSGGFSGTQQVLFTAATRGDYTINLGASGTTGQNIITHAFTPGFSVGINESFHSRFRSSAFGLWATSDDACLLSERNLEKAARNYLQQG